MSHLRSVRGFGKYLLMNVSFSDIPCALPLGDRDEINCPAAVPLAKWDLSLHFYA